MKQNKTELSISVAIILLALSGCSDSSTRDDKKVLLGEKLFYNKDLSVERTISCATCHDPEHAWIDSRIDAMVGAGLKDDNIRRSDRNAPTLAYALYSPDFQPHYDNGNGVNIGGQLHDGRGIDLAGQAKVFLLKSAPMETYVERVKEDADTIYEFKNIYGDDIFDDTKLAFNAITDSIAAFEKSDIFSKFDSKYDHYLLGEKSLSTLEEEGLTLFKGKGKCISCHTANTHDGSKVVFSNFKYYNIGVPVNEALRISNGKGLDFIDYGLGKILRDSQFDGQFRIPTLRNIATTAPYMHNGLFKELKTVVHFHNTRDVAGSINPETNIAWQKGEVALNKDINEIGNLGLTDSEENAIVAFLKTLTDSEFEYLIPKK